MHVPFALEVRDLWPETLVALKGLSRANPVVVALRAVEWLLYRQARRIVTPLGGSERYFALKNVEPERVVWIPNGVDFNLLPQDRTSPKGAFKIYYAGAIGAPNAVDTLLDVAERVLRAKGPDEVQFHFLGEGTQKSALVQRAHKQCLTNVVFHQGVAKSEVFAKLQDAHAFIVTLRQSYLYEFGIGLNKLYDYLAMGRPVILGCPPVPEPVSLSGAGIRTPPEDVGALADAVLSLLSMSPPEIQQMGERGRTYVRTHHDFRILARRLEETLEGLCGESKARVGLSASA